MITMAGGRAAGIDATAQSSHLHPQEGGAQRDVHALRMGWALETSSKATPPIPFQPETKYSNM